MSTAAEFTEIFSRYMSARIPFVTVETMERQRALDLMRVTLTRLDVPGYVHTISSGVRDLKSGELLNEDTSVVGALDFAVKRFSSRANQTMILTDTPDISSDTAAARQLLDLTEIALQNSCSIVVITGDPVWSRLQRRGMALRLDNPSEAEMATMLREFLGEYAGQVPISWTDEDYTRASSIVTGITQVEAENILATLVAKGSVTPEDLSELSRAKDRIFSDISGLERIKVDMSQEVGGLDGLNSWLEQRRSFLTADLKERAMRPPRGVLLVGVPGCGKSLSAKAIAASWQLPLYRLDMASVFGKYVGESESQLKAALQTADHVAPCVLWIDEIEKGLAGTGSDNTGVTTRLVGQFLFWLQESTSRVFVVATANDVTALPPELLRRGRFDELFFVDLPTDAERREIISIYIRKYLRITSLDEAAITSLVSVSEGFSGADLESAIRDIAFAEMRTETALSADEVLQIVRNIPPMIQTNPERIEAIRSWGRERALPASGADRGQSAQSSAPTRRVLLR